MTTSAPSAPAPATPGPAKYKRSVKNYLIDSRFQLKYTAMIVGVALGISAVMGTFLYRTSQDVVHESQMVVEESKKVSDVVKMNIAKDPVYSDNPELATAFASGATDSDKKIEDQQRRVIKQQDTMLYALVGGLAAMVVLIGMLGIYFTHKVAGPIYKMKLLLKQVGDGKLTFQGKLRKGDELQDFFETFTSMVENLRDRQAKEVAELSEAIEGARKAGAAEEEIAKVMHVRDEMQKALEL
jgi:nitrogen fixation/metabolism regulation signal transduction histidine kinase